MGKQLLQHFPLDRFLQHWDSAKPAVDAVGVVAGDENERHVAPRQNFGHLVDHAVAEIDVEDRGVEVAVLGGRQGIGRGANRTDDLEAEFGHAFLDHDADQRFVLDHEHAPLVELVQCDGGAIAAIGLMRAVVLPRFLDVP